MPYLIRVINVIIIRVINKCLEWQPGLGTYSEPQLNKANAVDTLLIQCQGVKKNTSC